MGKVKDNLKLHFVNSTAMLAVGHPVFASFETGVAGMSDFESGVAKVVAGTSVYLGAMGWLYDKGNELWDGWFGITDDTGFVRKRAHECLYLSAFNMASTVVIYPLSMAVSWAFTGEVPDLEEVRTGVGAAGLFGLTFGGPILRYAVDVAKDLTGIEECNRALYRGLLGRQDEKVKRRIFGVGVGICLAATIGVYCVTPDKFLDSFRDQSQLESHVENVGLADRINNYDLVGGG